MNLGFRQSETTILKDNKSEGLEEIPEGMKKGTPSEVRE
jgi:hypothetical protein